MPDILEICTPAREYKMAICTSLRFKLYGGIKADAEICVASNFNLAIFIVAFVKFASDGHNVLLDNKNRFLMLELSGAITSGTNAKLRVGFLVLLQRAKPYGRTGNVVHIQSSPKRRELLTQ